MKVYLVHPFEGKAVNRLRAAWLTKFYQEQWAAEGKTDWEIINPIEELKDLTCGETERLLIARDLLYKCDAVLFAPGWVHSHECIYLHDAASASAEYMMIFHLPSELYKGGVVA